MGIMSGSPTRTTWKEERRLPLLEIRRKCWPQRNNRCPCKRNEFDFSLNFHLDTNPFISKNYLVILLLDRILSDIDTKDHFPSQVTPIWWRRGIRKETVINSFIHDNQPKEYTLRVYPKKLRATLTMRTIFIPSDSGHVKANCCSTILWVR